jgi:hypothetical protein
MKLKQLLTQNTELILWLMALVFVWIMPTTPLQSFCVFKQLGITFCPGCGIGKAMHEAMHAQWLTSWHYHKFGLPALAIITWRILQLLNQTKKYNHEPKLTNF